MKTTPLPTARGPGGFTLVELLVVIAIIAVLAAILFPVFAKARAKARQAHCLSNIRQVTTALLIYAADEDDCLPQATYYRPASRFSAPWDEVIDISWWDVIIPYLSGSTRLLFCPAMKHPVPDYLMNQFLGDPKYSFLGAVTTPADTFLIVEACPSNEYSKARVLPVTCAVFPFPEVPFHHFGRMNASFVDGHVKLVTEEAIALFAPHWYPFSE